MATIEPRLMLVPNEAMSDSSNHDLPPLRTLIPRTADRSLPPLEPHTNRRGDRLGIDIQASIKQVPALYPNDDISLNTRKDGNQLERNAKYSGSSAAAPLSLILDQTPIPTAYPLSNIIDEVSDNFDNGGNNKRHRGLLVKDDFMSLPQPIKKQKAVQKAPAFPPMINGLHDPPSHASVFPSISTFGNPEAVQNYFANNYGPYELNREYNHVDDEASNLQTGPEIGLALNYFEAKSISQPSSEADKDNKQGTEGDMQSSNAKKRSTKKQRRKWSESETNNLLIGVSRHGVGKWTSILDDPELKFDGRTAGDLKDRFRTCCPDELRSSGNGSQPNQTQLPPSIPKPASPKQARQRTRIDGHLDKILIDVEDPSLAQHDIDSNSKSRKSRAHRKNMSDLVQLGILTPFKKSHRRVRRPFTEQDDQEILEGLHKYGPAWTKIHRHQSFHLSSRQPTDLRDRVRNKYPEIYARIEKGAFQVKEGGRSNDVMEPSVNTLFNTSFLAKPNTLESSVTLNLSGTREDYSRRALPQMLDSAETYQPIQGPVFDQVTALPFIGNEMDVSRILLDDSTRLTQMAARPMHQGISASSSPTILFPDVRGDQTRGQEGMPGANRHPAR